MVQKIRKTAMPYCKVRSTLVILFFRRGPTLPTTDAGCMRATIRAG